MGNFNLKSIWKQTGGTGGSTNLEQRVQNIENNFARKKGVSSQNIDTVYHFNQPASFHNDVWIGRVGTNDESVINKQYLEQQLTATKNQIRTENNTFTGTNTFNNQVAINSQGQDFTWETTRTWANNVDNTVVRTKDLKYVRIFEKTSGIPQTTTTWNTSLNWTIQGINTDGIHEILIIVSIDNVAYTLNGRVVWKSGLSESKSQFITISNGAAEFMFQLVIKGGNEFRLYHKISSGQQTLQWIRGWIVRAGNQPWKMDQLW